MTKAYEVKKLFAVTVDDERVTITNDNVDDVFPKLTKKDQQGRVDGGFIRELAEGDVVRAAKSNEPAKPAK